MSVNVSNEGRFQPYLLEPGAPSAFTCFGTWENVRCCLPIEEVDDPLDGCSQSVECRRYTLEQNPPTTRFRVKPRRDGRFEIQQFRDFIGEHSSYHMEITEGLIEITYPGKRNVPKSRRFFLHVKHLEEAKLPVDVEFELIMSLEKMVLRQAGAEVIVRAVRHTTEDPDDRRKRIAEKLRAKATAAARDESDDDDLDIEIDLELDTDGDDGEDFVVVPVADANQADEVEESDDDFGGGDLLDAELDVEVSDADKESDEDEDEDDDESEGGDAPAPKASTKKAPKKKAAAKKGGAAKKPAAKKKATAKKATAKKPAAKKAAAKKKGAAKKS